MNECGGKTPPAAVTSQNSDIRDSNFVSAGLSHTRFLYIYIERGNV